MAQSYPHSKPTKASLLTLRVPDGYTWITLEDADGNELSIKINRDLRGDGHYHFIREDGTVIPLDVPAVIDVLPYLEEHPSFFINDQQLDKATARAKVIYSRMRAAGRLLKYKTIAKEALRELSPNLSAGILDRCGDTIRHRLKTWIENEGRGKK